MLTIETTINGHTIKKYHVWRISGEAHERCHYVIYEGLVYIDHVWHEYDDGAQALATKVLQKLNRKAAAKGPGRDV